MIFIQCNYNKENKDTPLKANRASKSPEKKLAGRQRAGESFGNYDKENHTLIFSLLGLKIYPEWKLLNKK